MSVLVAYEVHRYNAGRWEIQAIFDDKELALMEARRLESGLRPQETRVVEEVHDEGRQRTRTKTVYETPPVRPAGAPAAAAPATVPKAKAKPAPKKREIKEPKQTAPRPRPEKSGPSLWVIGLTFVVIIAGGAAALMALNTAM